MANVTEIQIYIKSEVALNADTNRYQSEGRTYPTPLRDVVVSWLRQNGFDSYLSEYFTCIDIFEVENLDDLKCFSSLSLRVRDAAPFVENLTQAMAGTALAGKLDFFIGTPFPDPDSAENQNCKSIEVYYDVDAIPDGYESPLDFRNEAMELIEVALESNGAGEWSGAESGMGEMNFGFDVTNFAKAEAIVRKSVKGTKYDCIRDITRFDSSKDLPPETLAELGIS